MLLLSLKDLGVKSVNNSSIVRMFEIQKGWKWCCTVLCVHDPFLTSVNEIFEMLVSKSYFYFQGIFVETCSLLTQ